MIDVKDMTVNEMDAWAANAYSLMKVTEQEAEAKAFYRCGEFIRELGERIEKLNASVTNWNRENEKNIKRVAALENVGDAAFETIAKLAAVVDQVRRDIREMPIEMRDRFEPLLRTADYLGEGE